MSTRVLVTGAAGFIGSHLCRGLVAEGRDVVGLDDLSEGSMENLAGVPEVRFVEADLRDEAAVAQAAKGCGTIFHHGAKRSVSLSVEEPGLTTDVNVRGTLNVLLAARDVGATVVGASSSSVYGDQDTFPLHEGLTPRPRSPYAASKFTNEIYGASWWIGEGVPSVWLRYFNVYGPGQSPESEYAAVIPRFVMACLTGRRPVIYGDGEQSRDFTYVDDVVEANVRSAAAPETAYGRAFNIGGGRTPTSVNRLLDIIARLCDVEPVPTYDPPRAGDIRLSEADISLANELLGYVPKVGIEEGLARTVDAFRSTV